MPKEPNPAQIEALQKENAVLRAAAEQRAALDKQIADKMAFGLTRDQAAAVIKRQAGYNAARKNEVEPARK